MTAPPIPKPREWMRGFEVEMMAPSGSSRHAFARALAASLGGTTRTFFSPSSEPSAVPGVAAFDVLSLGTEIVDRAGRQFGSVVDDLTLNADLAGDLGPGEVAAPKEAPYRLVSTQKAALELARIHCDPTADIAEVLEPIAALFRSRVRPGEGGIYVVNARSGNVLAALPECEGRERACEFVSAPLCGDRAFFVRYLGLVFEHLERLAFFVPRESATHVHFDGEPFLSVPRFRNLVRALLHYGPEIKARFEGNPNCVRLGDFDSDFLSAVAAEEPSGVAFPAFAARMLKTGVSKWCDFNVFNLLYPHAGKCTVEFRTLGTRLDAERLFEISDVFARLLARVASERRDLWDGGQSLPATLDAYLGEADVG